MSGFNPYSVRDIESAVVPVLDPETKKKTGATITVASPEHPKAKAIRFASERKMRKSLEKTGKLLLDDPELDLEKTLDELVAVTLDWDGFCNDDKTPIPFTVENVRKLYTDLVWLREQVLEARKDRALFIKRCEVNSLPT